MTDEQLTEMEALVRRLRGVRCEYCDGTGDVHRADGEWLGSCDCTKTADALTTLIAAAREGVRLREELAALKAEIRENTPYTAEEIEVFQSCFDRGLIGVDDLIKYPRDERVARARAALAQRAALNEGEK